MKNLLNTIVFKSVALFAMVLLVAFAVTTSFNPMDQSNDIRSGVKVTSTTLKEDIGGSKGIKGEFALDEWKISDIGGRNSTTTGNFSAVDIGGRNSNGTVGESHVICYDIGGRGNELGIGQYSGISKKKYAISDIGGRKDDVTGNVTFDAIGGSRYPIIIRRIPISFTSEIGGKSNTIGK